MDKYKIDGHKLNYHVDRVSQWRRGEIVYPIYMEVSPAGGCNHRCTFCAMDYRGYRKRFLNTAAFTERLTEMGILGIRSIMYAGEGEPLLHRDIARIIQATKAAGIDVAITTNGVFLDPLLIEQTMEHIKWIKISINGGHRDTYAEIHRTRPEDFDRVLDNIAAAAAYRDRKNLSCAVGMQMVLLPDNQADVLELAQIACATGADYFVVKPYSQHLMSGTTRYQSIRYQQYAHLGQELEKMSTERFHAVFRWKTMEKWDCKSRPYENCFALPFWAFIDSAAQVWGCSTYLGDERFCYGDLYRNSFQEVWEGQKRMTAPGIGSDVNLAECRRNCRMDEINRYLWELKHPSPHVNFI